MDNKITLENVEAEIKRIKDEAPLNCVNLERFILYCRTKKYLLSMHDDFAEADANEWIEHMDPPARWTKDQTTSVMHQHGYMHKPCEYWVVMNALVSDYGDIMAKYGSDRPDVWAELAHAWLDDKDAKEGKTGRYFKEIVKL